MGSAEVATGGMMAMFAKGLAAAAVRDRSDAFQLGERAAVLSHLDQAAIIPHVATAEGHKFPYEVCPRTCRGGLSPCKSSQQQLPSVCVSHSCMLLASHYSIICFASCCITSGLQPLPVSWSENWMLMGSCSWWMRLCQEGADRICRFPSPVSPGSHSMVGAVSAMHFMSYAVQADASH